MNNIERIRAAFKHKAFIPFITGGDPDIETTKKLIYTLARAGADIVEVGIPFSDPVAEGPVIEAADERALKAGCTVDKLFDMVKEITYDSSFPDIPILFMTYYNPIFGYGSEKFVANCVKSGIAGLIVPDLPFDERDELKIFTDKAEIALISLIAPTSGERIKNIAENSDAFLYCVSSLGVTGIRSNINNYAQDMINSVRKVSNIPCAVGFGVSDAQQAKKVSDFADGVIIGSAIVKIIAKHGRNALPHVENFAKTIVNAIR
ncbi:MAG: tryptophan synthase subunit alpha [Ruminococcus sp.]|jgi:tryptophan synthase alpha chain|nr:tryptophan synthase subunit alpha [Ruminococcus sp.]